MSFKSQRIRARARFGLRSLAIGALLWPAVCLGAPEPDKISVYVDQAKLLKLPAKVATIIVGNPLIADVTLQSGGIVVVTGKGYGATNFIAMDRSGDVLVDQLVQMQRSGFDSAVLRDDQDFSVAERQLSRFAAFYQGDERESAPHFRRAA